MQYRLKTSLKAMQILKDLQARTYLTPNVLARLAIGLSLRDSTTPTQQSADSLGLEFNRPTLTGDHEVLYKVLMCQHAKKNLSDDEFFPYHVRMHLERGVRMLIDEYLFAGNFEKLIINLSELE